MNTLGNKYIYQICMGISRNIPTCVSSVKSLVPAPAGAVTSILLTGISAGRGILIEYCGSLSILTYL